MTAPMVETDMKFVRTHKTTNRIFEVCLCYHEQPRFLWTDVYFEDREVSLPV